MAATRRKSQSERLGLRFESLSAHLHGLPPDALGRVIRYHQALAALLVQRRAELDKAARQARSAARQVARQPPSPLTPHGRLRLRAAQRRARNLEAVRLARRGWTNDMIGRRLGVAPSTVSRIIQRELRETRIPAPPSPAGRDL